MEPFLQSVHPKDSLQDTSEFQSLFLWNPFFKSRTFLQGFQHILVSILVFMEPFLQSHYVTIKDDIATMFQSLFLWNPFFNIPRLKAPLPWVFVSILVFMEPFLQYLNVGFLIWQYVCFNPCFYGTLSSILFGRIYSWYYLVRTFSRTR